MQEVVKDLQPVEPPMAYVPQRDVLTTIVANATKYVGITEVGGNNRGKEVEYFLATVGLKGGLAWCTAFTCTVLHESGVHNPMTGWTPALATHKTGQKIRKKEDYKAGMVFTLYYANLKREGHSGFITQIQGNSVMTVEGNTTNRGTRETHKGKDGVNQILRPKSALHNVLLYNKTYE
jgi:hypothetical protein